MNARTMLHAAFKPQPATAATGISFEELSEALADASDGLQEAQSQINETEDEVSDLQDELGSAQALQQAVESLAGTNSPAAHRALGIVLDHHLRRFNITLPSMENDAPAETVTAAKGDANKNLIQRIIAAIKSALARAGEYLKKVWERLTGGKEKIEAAAKKIEEVLHTADIGADGLVIKLHPAIYDVWVENGKFREAPGSSIERKGDKFLEELVGAIPDAIIESAQSEEHAAATLTRHVLPLLKAAASHAPLVEGWHTFHDFGTKPTALDIRFQYDEAAWNALSDENLTAALNSVKFSLGTKEGFEGESKEVRLSKEQMVAVAKQFPPTAHDLEKASQEIAHDMASGIRAADDLEKKLVALSADGHSNPHYEKHLHAIMALTGMMRRAAAIASESFVMGEQQMMSVMRAVLSTLNEKPAAEAPAAGAADATSAA